MQPVLMTMKLHCTDGQTVAYSTAPATLPGVPLSPAFMPSLIIHR